MPLPQDDVVEVLVQLGLNDRRAIDRFLPKAFGFAVLVLLALILVASSAGLAARLIGGLLVGVGNAQEGDARDCLYRSRPGPPFLGVCPVCVSISCGFGSKSLYITVLLCTAVVGELLYEWRAAVWARR